MRFRDDKSTANDEMVVKKILNSIQDGVTKEQLLLCMDRVRAAWKAREKGLPMPPLHSKPTGLSLSTQLSPTSSALNTPISGSIMLQSPSTSSSTGYFRERDDLSRNNSISEDIPSSKRKSSISSVTTPLKEQIVESDDAERKRLKAVNEEEEEESIPVNNNIPKEPMQVASTSAHHTSVPPITSPRRRKVSIVNVNEVKKSQLAEPDPPPPIGKKHRKGTLNASKRTAATPTVFIKQKERTPPLPTSPKPLLPPPLDNAHRANRRLKSIPQLHKESNSKKIKPSSSSSIHNLLTTSIEPTTRAYNFSTILQKEESQPAAQPVQFINFHAEGRNQAANNNHILIIRSETNSQTPAPPPPPPPPAWKNNAFGDSQYHPPYQEYYQPYPQQPQPYRQQQVANEYQPQQQPQQPKRKNSQKAKLDFILN